MSERAVVNETEEKQGKKVWSVKLVHPSYSIESCPNCEYPESDGGHCPECGWTRYRPGCPHCNK